MPLPAAAPVEVTTGLLLALLWATLVARARPAAATPCAVGVADARLVGRAGLKLTAATLVAAVVLDLQPEPSRLVAFVGVVVTACFARVWATDRLRGHDTSRGRLLRTVVVGDGPDLDRVVAELGSSGSRLSVVTRCVPGADGLADRVLATVDAFHADAVVVAPGQADAAGLRRLGWSLEPHGTELFVASGLTRVASSRTRLAHVGVLPLLHVAPADLRGARHVVKRIAERVLAGLALLVLMPLTVIIATLVVLTSSGPALYRQTRVGLDGRPFTMLKFRTMAVDADDRRTGLLATGAGSQLLFKMRQDPRVTPLGRLLRRASLDELPQLINVVRGDMALVGPRPALPSETALYDIEARRRLVVRPGLTGLWQVSGRSDLTWEESIRLDLRYVEGWSLGLDAWILLRTVGAVIGRRGAY